MKDIQASNGKGFLSIDWTSGKATLTEIKKDEELTYDFFETLEKYNNKEISFSIKVENSQQPIEE